MTNNNVINLEAWKREAAKVYDCMWTEDELRILAGADRAKSLELWEACLRENRWYLING